MLACVSGMLTSYAVLLAAVDCGMTTDNDVLCGAALTTDNDVLCGAALTNTALHQHGRYHQILQFIAL